MSLLTRREVRILAILVSPLVLGLLVLLVVSQDALVFLFGMMSMIFYY